MKLVHLFILFQLITVSIYAQESGQVVNPILLDRSVLSGIGLEKIEFDDEPEKDFYQKRLFRGEDISIYVVSTETWNNRMDMFPFDEFIYMFQGEALIKPDQGKSQLFYSGDYFFAPKGFTGEWEIRSGEHLHYELSVIATKRIDTSKIIHGDAHMLFDPTVLSGAHIQLDESGNYSEVLKSGAELKVELAAEKPMFKAAIEIKEDLMIHLLSGQLEIRIGEDSNHTFHTGDFFVLPAGLKGDWKSNGHGLIKYLIVSHS